MSKKIKLSDYVAKFLSEISEYTFSGHGSSVVHLLDSIDKIDNIKIDNEKIKNCINLTSFKNLRKIEEEKGFIEKGFGEFFFRKGKVGDWKEKLNENLVKKIEEKFKLEMKELGYID